MSLFLTPPFLWGLGIVVGVAIAIVVLTEIIDRLKRVDHPMAPVVQLLRNVVLLLMAIFFVQRMIMELTFISLPVRLVATGMWIFVIVVIMRTSSILFKEEEGSTWHDNIPRLFKRLPVLVVVFLIAAYVLQDIWRLPLGEYATALGLGSVAIAFALQDTLSNLVSGLFILFNRPFVEGEWIHIGDTEGRVLSVTWRYTHIETRNGDLIVIPNGSIAQDSITNHSQPLPRSRVVQSIVVAYSNPPNKVTRMLVDTMLATPGILADPTPMVAVTAIDDPLMGYEMRYWIGDYASKPAIHNALMTRIWYAARRYDVVLPSPAFDLYHYDAPTVNVEAEITPEKIVALLNSVETFAMLPEEVVEDLATAAAFEEYARSESMAEAGEIEQGLSVIINGHGRMTITDADGVDHLIEQLGPGEIFGETGLFGRPVSPYTIVAEDDVELVRIDYTVVNRTINRHPQFASGVNAFIKRRRLTVERITDAEEASTQESSAVQTNGHRVAVQGETR